MPSSKTNPGISWRQSIGFRLFLMLFLLVAVISVFIFLYFPARLRSQALEAIKNRSQTTSEFLAFSLSPALVFNDSKTASETADAVKQNQDIAWIIVHDARGTVFVSAGLDLARKLSYELPENKNAVLGDGEVFMTYTPIMQNGETFGGLYVGYSLASLNQSIRVSRTTVSIISAVVLILGSLIAWFISRFFSRNLNRMVETMEKVGTGNLDVRAVVTSRDEIGYLAEAFNQMVARLDISTQDRLAQEAQFRTLVANMNEGLVELDEEGHIRFANSKFCKLFGYLEIEVMGQNILRVTGVKPQDEKLFFGVASGETDHHQFEVELKNQQGISLWALVSMSPGVQNSAASFWTAIFTDITSLKRTENNLRFKNRELDTFVYRASHDLKAPLSSLQGLVAIAKEESNDPLSRRYFELIAKTTDKMDGVLMGLLEITWIKQGAFDLTKVRLDSLLEEILTSISHIPGHETVQIRNHVLAGTELVSDPKLLTSILQNLVHNAIKYHRESGSNKYVEITARRLGRGLEIVVKDNGPGIEDAAQEKLFDMFFRASNKSKGSGLGLYIVKNAVEKLKGTITLKSRLGEGSEFVLFLPLLEVSA